MQGECVRERLRRPPAVRATPGTALDAERNGAEGRPRLVVATRGALFRVVLSLVRCQFSERFSFRPLVSQARRHELVRTGVVEPLHQLISAGRKLEILASREVVADGAGNALFQSATIFFLETERPVGHTRRPAISAPNRPSSRRSSRIHRTRTQDHVVRVPANEPAARPPVGRFSFRVTKKKRRCPRDR